MPFAFQIARSLQSRRDSEAEERTAFPTVRQGAGKVGFPVDIFCCFHPGSARVTCPVLSVLAGFPSLLLIMY